MAGSAYKTILSSLKNSVKQVSQSVVKAVAALPGQIISAAVNVAVGAVLAVVQPFLDIVNGAIGFVKGLADGSIFKTITDEITGVLNGIIKSAVNTVNAILDPLKRLGELKDNVKEEVKKTAKIPEQTSEAVKTSALASSNFIKTTVDGTGKVVETAIGNASATLKRDKALQLNTPSIADCIKQRVKDIIGIFTAPLGLFSVDQFKPTIPSISIADAFAKTLGDITGAVTGTIDGISNLLNFKFLNQFNQQEAGRLTLGKFLGCDVDLKLTPRQKRDAQKLPNLTDEITKKETERSVAALKDQSIKETENRTADAPTGQDNFGNLPEPLSIAEFKSEYNFLYNAVYLLEDFSYANTQSGKEVFLIKNSPNQNTNESVKASLNRAGYKKLKDKIIKQLEEFVDSQRTEIETAKDISFTTDSIGDKVRQIEGWPDLPPLQIIVALQARQNNIKSRINSSKAIGEEDIEIAIAEGLEFNFANKSNSVPLIAPAGIEEKALTVNRLYKKITKRDYNKLAESILRTLGYTQRRTFSL